MCAQKPKELRNVRWVWRPFHNSARTDGYQLSHWVTPHHCARAPGVHCVRALRACIACALMRTCVHARQILERAHASKRSTAPQLMHASARAMGTAESSALQARQRDMSEDYPFARFNKQIKLCVFWLSTRDYPLVPETTPPLHPCPRGVGGVACMPHGYVGRPSARDGDGEDWCDGKYVYRE